MTSTSEDNPFATATWVAAQLAQRLLRTFGKVPPTAVALIGRELRVETVFPAERAPFGVSNMVLFDAIRSSLIDIAAKQGGLAAVATLFKPDDDDHVVVQVELTNGTIIPMAFLPTRRNDEWEIGTPLPNEEGDHEPLLPLVFPRRLSH